LPQARETPTYASARRVMLVMMSLSTLYNYLYSMTISSAYGLSPILGGALYMSGTVATAFAQTFLGDNRKYLTRLMRITGTLLLALMLFLSLVIFTLFPVFSAPSRIWALFAVVLALTMRAILGRRLVGMVMLHRINRKLFLLAYGLLQLIPAAVLLPLFFHYLPQATAWQSLGGYGLSVLLEAYTHYRERDVIAHTHAPEAVDAASVQRVAQALSTVHAYGAYQRLQMPILMALQVTLVMMYTFIGITTAEMIGRLALSVACTILMREVTDYLLSHTGQRKLALLPLLLFGLLLWLYGLVLLYRELDRAQSMVVSYLTLSLCTGGLTIAITCLAQMERAMAGVAEYGLKSDLIGYGRYRAVYTEFAILLGQLAALVLLAFLSLPSSIALEDMDLAFVVRSFRPLMVVPPLLLLVGAVASVLRFPMNNRHFEKLKRFLTMTDAPNPALKKQLDAVVVARHKNRYGVKLLLMLLRPFYYHKLKGLENAAGHADGTMVLVCNHGELYGPIVTNLYIPISFRPWTVSKMLDRNEIVRHIYENSMLRQQWLPSSLKLPLTKLIARVCLWAFASLECIPVYRDSPRELIKTFRLTTEAMQAGDNILLFPERDQPEAPGERGYALEGVGELYTGFAMIAPAYYVKTQQRVVFLPIYASKHLRTITIGQGVRYDPQAPATEEKLRIVSTLLERMEGMYAIEREELARREAALSKRLKARRFLSKAARRQLEAMNAAPDVAQPSASVSPAASPAAEEALAAEHEGSMGDDALHAASQQG